RALLGVPRAPRPRAAARPRAGPRRVLGQHPRRTGRGDAARRLQDLRLRQGPLRLQPGGLHPDQARDERAGLDRRREKDGRRRRTPPPPAPLPSTVWDPLRSTPRAAPGAGRSVRGRTPGAFPCPGGAGGPVSILLILIGVRVGQAGRCGEGSGSDGCPYRSGRRAALRRGGPGGTARGVPPRRRRGVRRPVRGVRGVGLARPLHGRPTGLAVRRRPGRRPGRLPHRLSGPLRGAHREGAPRPADPRGAAPPQARRAPDDAAQRGGRAPRRPEGRARRLLRPPLARPPAHPAGPGGARGRPGPRPDAALAGPAPRTRLARLPPPGAAREHHSRRLLRADGLHPARRAPAHPRLPRRARRPAAPADHGLEPLTGPPARPPARMSWGPVVALSPASTGVETATTPRPTREEADAPPTGTGVARLPGGLSVLRAPRVGGGDDAEQVAAAGLRGVGPLGGLAVCGDEFSGDRGERAELRAGQMPGEVLADRTEEGRGSAA